MRRLRKQQGSALLEFALTGVLLSASLTGVISIGWNAYVYDALVTRVTDGARYASRMDCDGETPSVAEYKASVQNFVVYGNPSGGTSSVLPNLRTTNVNVQLNNASTNPTVTVSVAGYTVGIGSLGAFTLIDRPSVTMPYAGYCN
jgi:Flp pilus assembly protein TadG